MVPKRKRQSKQIKSSLRISTVEGSWWAVMYGMVETYFGAFFEYLKYTSYEISILSTLPIFIGAVFQNLTGWFYDILRSRKTLLIILKRTKICFHHTVHDSPPWTFHCRNSKRGFNLFWLSLSFWDHQRGNLASCLHSCSNMINTYKDSIIKLAIFFVGCSIPA